MSKDFGMLFIVMNAFPYDQTSKHLNSTVSFLFLFVNFIFLSQFKTYL